jgi:hypothetical protein
VTTHTNVSLEQDSCLEVFSLLWNPKLHCLVHVHTILDCILNPAESSPTLTLCSLEFLLRIIPPSTYCSPKWSLYCELPIQNVNSSIHFPSPVISIVRVLSLDFYTSVYPYINVQIHTVAYTPIQHIYCVSFGYIHVCTLLVRSRNHVYWRASRSRKECTQAHSFFVTIQSQSLPHSILLRDHFLGIQFAISLSTLSPAFQ